MAYSVLKIIYQSCIIEDGLTTKTSLTIKVFAVELAHQLPPSQISYTKKKLHIFRNTRASSGVQFSVSAKYIEHFKTSVI